MSLSLGLGLALTRNKGGIPDRALLIDGQPVVISGAYILIGG